jgi:hypothetical protein
MYSGILYERALCEFRIPLCALFQPPVKIASDPSEEARINRNIIKMYHK